MAPPDDIQRDREWIERIRRGDEQAFAALFETYYPLLCEFVRISVGSAEIAEEVVDDVLFTIVWEQRGTSIPSDQVAPYLFGAVRNKALNEIRGQVRRWRREARYAEETDVTDTIASAESIGFDGEESVDTPADQLMRIRQIVDTLPERCREIFLLRWTAHLPYAAIAEITHVSVKTVENQLAIALKRLREQLCLPS